MSSKTKSTVKMLCIRSTVVMRKELPEAAQALLETYSDPDVSPVEKAKAKKKLDEMIGEIESRVTTRRLNERRDQAQ